MAQERDRERRDEMVASQTRIEEKLKNLEKAVVAIQLSLLNNYVTQEAFAPVKLLVFGMVGLILMTVVLGLLALVVKK